MKTHRYDVNQKRDITTNTVVGKSFPYGSVQVVVSFLNFF